MRAVDNALMITEEQAPEFNCSAVWGGKLLSASETSFGSLTSKIQPCASFRMPAITPQEPGSKTARGAN